MKKYILMALSVCALTACDLVNGEGNASDNAVFMGNPNASGVVSMVVSDAKGGSTFVTPRLANMAEQPVEVTVSLDEEALAAYNQSAGLAIEPVDANDFVLVVDGKEYHGSAKVKIAQGQFNGSVEVKMPSVDPEKYGYGTTYAIPLSITGSSAYKVLSTPKTTIIRLSRQLVTSVGFFSTPGSICLGPSDELREPIENWTMQVSMYYPSLGDQSTNQTVMSIQNGTGAFYTRIGKNNGIQFKHGRDGDDTWTMKPLETNKWLNISFVHDGSSMSIYVNGELQKTFDSAPIYFSKASNCCLFIGNTKYSGVYIREARMWNRCLTLGEIIDKEYLPQDPNDPSLIMYMPFTKPKQPVEGNLGLEELTGNWTKIGGFKDFADDGQGEGGPAITYVENVLFPSYKLEYAEVEEGEEEEEEGE